MDNRKNLKYILCYLVVTLALFIAGNAYAQHEGGLGEKKIHLNISDSDQLMMIEGVTEELAEAIVEYREESGFFKKPEELLKVPGITQDVYETMDPQVGSEGDLYCVPSEEMEDEFDEDEEPVLSPSKC